MKCKARSFASLWLLSMTLLGLSGLTVIGQTAKGTILGAIKDQQESAVPRAEVQVVHLATNTSRTTVANDHGLYEFPALDVGKYSVTATAPNFKQALVNIVAVTLGRTERLDITLEVGDVSSQVVVVAGTALLHTDEATVSTDINSRQVTDLPLANRDVTAYQLLAPGTAAGYNGGTSLGINLNTGVVVNGTRITQGTSVTLDGGDNTSEMLYHAAMKPSVDAVEEVRFQTGVYSAEHGRAPSNLAIVTKSGANQFHGSAFWFLQNEALNARNFFTLPTQSKPVVRLNQFGGTLGGPVVKDKLFFFFSYEGARDASPIEFFLQVPTAQMRTGNFSGVNRVIRDPVTGLPFPGNIIPQARISRFASLLNTTLLPQANVGTNIWQNTTSSRTVSNQYNTRIDYNLTSNDRLFGRYSFQRNHVGQDYIGQPNLPRVDDITLHNFLLGETHTFNSRAINEFRFTFHREVVLLQGPAETQVDFLKDAGVSGLDPHFLGYPQIGVTGYTVPSQGAFPNNFYFNTFQADDSITYIRGAHSYKAGVAFRRFQSNQDRNSPNSRGVWQFNGLITGDGFADLLLGHPNSVTWGPPAGGLYDRFSYANAYLQDTWKVNTRLTLNLGIRYDLFARQTEKYNRISSVDFPTGKIVVAGDVLPSNLDPRTVASFPPGTIVPASQIPGLPVDTLRGGDHNNFAPRFGIAWRPFGTRTVIRGGYGLYFSLPDAFTDAQPSGVGGGRIAPWAITRTITSTRADIDISNPFGNLSAPTVQLPSGRYHGGPEFRDGYIHQYSLMIERQVANATVVEIGYFGSAGRKLSAEIENFNSAPPGNPNNIQARRRYPNLGPITYVAAVGESDYNSLQLRFEKRYSRGFSFSANYTFGRAIFNTAQGGRALNVFNPLDINGFRGRGDWDITHRFVAHWIVDIPIGQGRLFLNRGGILNAIIGGWEVTGIANLQSGPPFTVTSSRGATLSGTGSVIGMRANRIADGNLPESERTLLRWFDTNAFQTLPPQSYGNAGTGILEGDGITNFDIGLFKNFKITEGHVLQLRGEFYNAFNHPDFMRPNSDVDSAFFGRVTSARAGRAIQIALKYTF